MNGDAIQIRFLTFVSCSLFSVHSIIISNASRCVCWNGTANCSTESCSESETIKKRWTILFCLLHKYTVYSLLHVPKRFISSPYSAFVEFVHQTRNRSLVNYYLSDTHTHTRQHKTVIRPSWTLFAPSPNRTEENANTNHLKLQIFAVISSTNFSLSSLCVCVLNFIVNVIYSGRALLLCCC